MYTSFFQKCPKNHNINSDFDLACTSMAQLPLNYQNTLNSTYRFVRQCLAKTKVDRNMKIGRLHTFRTECVSFLTIMHIRSMVAEISKKIMNTKFRKFLGEPPDQHSWGRFHRIIMSWNVKYFLGDISGEHFRNYLCLGILSIFWGWFLGTISENNYVLDY